MRRHFPWLTRTGSLMLEPINSRKEYIHAENATLFCQIIGEGKPLIIIHGGAGEFTHDYLLPHMERLAEKHCVILYDQRALGKSTGEITPDQINLKTYVDDIESIRRSLGVNEISLLGHSFGGLLAMLYSLSYPESVHRMILSNSMVATSDDWALFSAELSKRTAPFQQEIQELKRSLHFLAGDPKTVMKVNQLYYQTYLYHPLLIDKLNLWKTQTENMNGRKVLEIFKTQILSENFNFLPDLKNIHCPTLIIHGTEDIIPLIGSEHLQRAIPHSYLVKIDQCGHFPFIEQPEAYFKIVEDFLLSRL